MSLKPGGTFQTRPELSSETSDSRSLHLLHIFRVKFHVAIELAFCSYFSSFFSVVFGGSMLLALLGSWTILSHPFLTLPYFPWVILPTAVTSPGLSTLLLLSISEFHTYTGNSPLRQVLLGTQSLSTNDTQIVTKANNLELSLHSSLLSLKHNKLLSSVILPPKGVFVNLSYFSISTTIVPNQALNILPGSPGFPTFWPLGLWFCILVPLPGVIPECELSDINSLMLLAMLQDFFPLMAGYFRVAWPCMLPWASVSFCFSHLPTWLILIYLINLSSFLGKAPFVSSYPNPSPPVTLVPLHLGSPPLLSVSMLSCELHQGRFLAFHPSAPSV